MSNPEPESFIGETSITYYEICMERDQPLTGCNSGECADLRAELDLFRTRRPTLRLSSRIRRKDLLRLLKQAEVSSDEWLDLHLKLRPGGGLE